MQWQLTGILPGTGYGALMRSSQQALPPVNLAAAGMPGCFAHVLAPVATLFVAPGTSQNIPESIPNSTALVGFPLVGQAVTYNPALNALGLVASNAVVTAVGL